MTEKSDRQDLAWRVIGALIGLGTTFVARKAIEYGWEKVTGKKPPADLDSPEIGMAEAIGYAVLMGVGMEVTRIVATRTAAKRWQSYKRKAGGLS
ncbi:MAG: DUF4235 domain-containing protein [Actinomycetes bacterium]|jgi:hypothetical protein|nr:MAG: hypothetical protein DIU60_09985 [Actinomycetota bacterium]